MIDRERFTPARPSCREPDRSAVPPEWGVGKEPGGEPSLSGEPECLSLHSPILASACKKWNQCRYAAHFSSPWLEARGLQNGETDEHFLPFRHPCLSLP
jgi:hypothetical protein